MTYSGAGVLPYTVIGGQTYFIFGKEKTHKQWCDFGGKRDPQETKPQRTAARECYEELRKLIDKDTIQATLGTKPVVKVTQLWPDNTTNYHLYLSNFKADVGKSIPKINNLFKKFKKNNRLPHQYMEKTKLTLVAAPNLKRAIESAGNCQNVHVVDYKNNRIQLYPFTAKVLSNAIPAAGAAPNANVSNILNGRSITGFTAITGNGRI